MIHLPEGMIPPWQTATQTSSSASQGRYKPTGSSHFPTGTNSGSAALLPQKLERCTHEELMSHLHSLSSQYTQLIQHTKEILLKRNESATAGIIITDASSASEGMLAVLQSPLRRDLERVGHHLLLLDVVFALQNRVELVLWSDLFKLPLDVTLQLCREMKDSRDQQQQYLAKCALLDLASHFYLRLVDSLCLVYSVWLHPLLQDHTSNFSKRPSTARLIREPYEMFTRHSTLDWPPGDGLHQSPLYEDTPPRSEIKNPEWSTAVRKLLQHCLLHLGDVARYRNTLDQAAFFYLAALRLNPANGHAFNQLGLLPFSSLVGISSVPPSMEDVAFQQKLHWWYYSVRALHCDAPFVKAESNLRDLAQKVLDQAEMLTAKGLKSFPPLQTFLLFHAHLLQNKGFLNAKHVWERFLSHLRLFMRSTPSQYVIQAVVIHIGQLASALKHMNHLDEVSSRLEEALESGVAIRVRMSVKDADCGLFSPYLKWPASESTNTSSSNTDPQCLALNLVLLLQANGMWIRALAQLAEELCGSTVPEESPEAQAERQSVLEKTLSALCLLLFTHRELRALYVVPNSHLWSLFPFHETVLAMLNKTLLTQRQLNTLAQLKVALVPLETSEEVLKMQALSLPEVHALLGFRPLNLPLKLISIHLPPDNSGNADAFKLEHILTVSNKETEPSESQHSKENSETLGKTRCLIILQSLRQCGLCRFRGGSGEDAATSTICLLEELPAVKRIPPPVEEIPVRPPAILQPPPSNASGSKAESAEVPNGASSTSAASSVQIKPQQSATNSGLRRQNVALNSFNKPVSTPATEPSKPVEASSFINVGSPLATYLHLTSQFISAMETPAESSSPSQSLSNSTGGNSEEKTTSQSTTSSNQYTKELPPRFQRLAAQQANMRSFQGPYKAMLNGDISMMDLSKKESELEESILEATANVEDQLEQQQKNLLQTTAALFPPPAPFMPNVPPPPLPLLPGFRHPPPASPSPLSSFRPQFSEFGSRPPTSPPSLFPSPLLSGNFCSSVPPPQTDLFPHSQQPPPTLPRFPPAIADNPLMQLYQQQLASRASTVGPRPLLPPRPPTQTPLLQDKDQQHLPNRSFGQHPRHHM